MSQTFLDEVNNIYPLSNELQEVLTQYYEVVDCPKKQLLLKAGQTCNHVYYIVKGLIRSYYIRDSEEICSRFMQEEHIALSIDSFYTRKPGVEYIETVEDCTLVKMNYEDLQNIYKQYPEFNFIARVWTEHYCIMSDEKLLMLRKNSAQERYLFFMENHPDLIQRLPLTYIASYLGMSLETLSRIRKKLSA
ncbi:MAG: Crp/Fnr family transcriptional regulator [Flavipsychrobacter sp.]